MSASVYHQLGIVAQEQLQWATAVAHYNQVLALTLNSMTASQASTFHQLVG